MENSLNTLFGTQTAGDAGSTPNTLVARTYATIRDDIITGQLAPNLKLRIESLREHYNVGAGTLREALGLLVSDALVVSQGQRGFRVAPMSPENFFDIADLRGLLEAKAFQSSIENADDQWEALIISTFYTLSKAEKRLENRTFEDVNHWENCNKAFHQALLSKCTSRWTLHFIYILWGQGDRYRRILLKDYPQPSHLLGEHDAIKDAALDRDVDKAVVLLTDHIRAGYELLSKAASNHTF
ncbi:MAG: FCD domain-containing protein [Kordiimonadaceae bacterium]|nr:FCD domain-containing protein [Kordiimonadaceae bacterium]